MTLYFVLISTEDDGRTVELADSRERFMRFIMNLKTSPFLFTGAAQRGR